jgi:DNA polymerase-1
MIGFARNNGNMIETGAEFPTLPNNIDKLYLDFETTSGDSKLDSLNPWHNCKPAGYAFTYDKIPAAWYVPWNVPRASEYLRMIIARSKEWINHNVKYDAHVFTNNTYVGITDLPILSDTIVGAKLIDSDRGFGRGGYGLDALARDWLKEDISGYESALQTYLYKNKDYGRIPADILGEYACQDVLTNRRLADFIAFKMPDECRNVWETETKLTRILFDVEQTGLRVDPVELMKRELITMHTMLLIEAQLEQLCQRPIRPHTNADCFDVLCGQYGLPVGGYTEAGEPSFSKHILLAYLSHPLAPVQIVKLIMQYRVLHTSYNQIVRTGRMACKWPNSQQLDKAAKELIHPRDGNAFLSIDYSQIEFRTIVHYIHDETCIAAFNKNPDEDFHQMIANMVGIKRKPAKTVNFMVGFGAGKKKTIKTLSAMGDVVASIKEEIDALGIGITANSSHAATFARMAEQRAEKLLREYHEMLPGVKTTSRKAEAIAKRNGFVRNLAGRRRHIPNNKAYIAFNTLNQSSAADIMKERTVAVSEMLAGTPLRIVASVHDELLIEGPIGIVDDANTVRDVVACMEASQIKLRVPIRCSAGTSSKHWRDAGSDENTHTIQYLPENITNLSHLRVNSYVKHEK